MMCARCEKLEEEVAYLKSELGLQEDAASLASVRALGLAPGEARVVLALYGSKGRPLTRLQIEERIPPKVVDERVSTQVVNVYVSRIRSKLGRDFIENVHSVGYRLSKRAVAEVCEAITQDRMAGRIAA